jgi:hypothetical protein
MGISVADTLRALAREIRTQRRQQAEELARKAPNKMVPVLIFLRPARIGHLDDRQPPSCS